MQFPYFGNTFHCFFAGTIADFYSTQYNNLAGTEELYAKEENRPHGHFCKSCSRLSVVEKAAAMDINRMMNFPMRLSDSEKKWLENKTHDKRMNE